MARNESDREDLIREAVALTNRAEFQLNGVEGVITAGYRSNEALSLFFDQDPVYQFDPEGRLRRAFVDGYLFRSQHTGLARLERQRTNTETILLRYDLTTDELEAFRRQMLVRLESLFQALETGRVKLLRVVPEGDERILQKVGSSIHSIRTTSSWLSNLIPARK